MSKYLPTDSVMAATRGTLVFLVLALSLGCATRQVPKPVALPTNRCAVPEVQGASPSGVLRIADCLQGERHRIQGVFHGPSECSIQGAVLHGARLSDRPYEPRLWITKDSAPSTESEVRIDPAVTLKSAGGFVEPTLTCDVDSSRFFYASSGLGYVVGLDTHGRELWRADVPGFNSIVPSLEKLGQPTVDQVMTLLDSSGSLVTKLIVSGAYLLVEVRTADRYFDSVFHRSGAFIGTIGPWNAVVLGPVEGGWRLSYTSDSRPDEYFFPDRELILTINDDTIGPLADHMIAAVTPAATADGYSWSLCPGIAGLGDILGERWRADLAKTALHVRDSLGTDWIGEMAKRIGRPGPLGIRRALLAAGVDVEMIRAWHAAGARESPDVGTAGH